MRHATTRQQTPVERERARLHGEVMTPEWMVDDMLTALDACDTSLGAIPISNPDVPLLDMCGGTGNFALGVVERRARSAGKPADAVRNVRMIELDEGNVDIARQRCMLALRDAYGKLTAADETEARHILEKNFMCGDALMVADVMSPDKCRVIVSNPPYQKNIANSNTVRNRSKALPCYQQFWDAAVGMNPTLMAFIIPAKWYTGGWGLDAFRAGMLADRHIAMLSDYRTSETVFPTASVNGGVCWIVRDAEHATGMPLVMQYDADSLLAYHGRRPLTIGGCPVLLRDVNAFGIVNKALAYAEESGLGMVRDRMLGTTPFGLPAKATSFPHTQEREHDDDIEVLCIRQGRVYVRPDIITRNADALGKWKVVVQLCHNQYDADPMSEAVVLPPMTTCTHSWVCTEGFDTMGEAVAMRSYMNTDAFRFLVSLMKISPIGTRKVYGLVPMLPLDREWDDDAVADALGLDAAERAYVGRRMRTADDEQTA